MHVFGLGYFSNKYTACICWIRFATVFKCLCYFSNKYSNVKDGFILNTVYVHVASQNAFHAFIQLRRRQTILYVIAVSGACKESYTTCVNICRFSFHKLLLLCISLSYIVCHFVSFLMKQVKMYDVLSFLFVLFYFFIKFYFKVISESYT